MNKTANIQASFSLPDVLVEDKIERMGNNQMKITIPKTRSMAKDSAPIVYAVQPLICDGLFRPRRSAPVKLECAGLCTNWGECYRSLRGLLVVVSIGLVFNVELSLNKH